MSAGKKCHNCENTWPEGYGPICPRCGHSLAAPAGSATKMNLQIETLTLSNGGKVDAIRDVEMVSKLIDASNAIRGYLESPACVVMGFDVPDEIWIPFTRVTESPNTEVSDAGPVASNCNKSDPRRSLD